MVIINLFKSKRKMLPGYSNSQQPYFSCPNLMTLSNPFVYQNNFPYIFQNFFPQTSFSHINPNLNFNGHPSSTSPPQPATYLKLQGLNLRKKQNLSKTLNRIAKEKFIRKATNRPATYLTERKFYLAQPPNQQNNAQRVLRPRESKKKHLKNKLCPQLPQQLEKSPLPQSQRDPEVTHPIIKEQLTPQKEKMSSIFVLKQEQGQRTYFQLEKLSKERALMGGNGKQRIEQ